MSFLTLMGITVPVEEQSGGTVDIVNQGEYGRAFSGVPIADIRAESPEYKGRWPFVPRDIATAYGLLIRGKGEGFRFVAAGVDATADLYSSKALAPVTYEADLAVTTWTTDGPVDNAGWMEIAYAGSVTWAMPPSPLNAATMSAWVRNANSTTGWQHYVVESVGDSAVALWVDGVSATLGTAPLSLEGWCVHPSAGIYEGRLLLAVETQDDEEATGVGQLVVLPFRASLLESGWASYMYNGGAGRLAEDFRYLTMGGTWPAAGADTVLGEIGQEQLRTVYSGGQAVQYASRDFTLRSTSTES